MVYLIIGFRWGFYGISDLMPAVSLGMTLVFLLLCFGAVRVVFKTGYRVKH